jgi:hypothetical protein
MIIKYLTGKTNIKEFCILKNMNYILLGKLVVHEKYNNSISATVYDYF